MAWRQLFPPPRVISISALIVPGESMAQANGDSTSNCGSSAVKLGGGEQAAGRARDFAAMRALGPASKEDREAAINMLPNADPTIHSCDACNKDITGVRKGLVPLVRC